MGIIARQSIKGTAVTYVGAFIGFLSTFLIQTQYLQPGEIGLLQVMLQAATLLSGFAMLGLNSSVYRFFPFFKEVDPGGRISRTANHNGFLYYTLLISLIGLALIIPLYYLLREPITEMYIKNSPDFLCYFHEVIPLSVCLLFWLVFELYAVQLLRIAVPKLIREVLLRILLIGIYVIYAFGWVSFPVLVALYISCYGLCMLLCIIYVGRIGSISLRHNCKMISPELKRNFIRYTLIYVLGSVGTKLVSQLDLFMIGSLDKGGMTATGIFSIAFFMVAIVEIPSRSLLNIATPMMADAMKEGNLSKADSLFKRVALHQVLTGGFIFLIVLINIDNVYAVIPKGDIYVAGKWAFIWLGLSKVLEVMFNYGNSIISCSRYYHWNIYYTIGVALLGIGLNIWLIPVYGITGAALATLATRFLSYGIQQAMISFKLRCSPFSPHLSLLLGLFAAAAGLNYIIPRFESPIVDALVRSLPIGIGLLVMVYFLRISPDANAIANKAFSKIFNRRHDQ